MKYAIVIATLAGCSSSNKSAPDGNVAADAAIADTIAIDSNAALPITAPDDQWTWVDFPDSKCASGTPTGIAINPHANATELMIYFEGGGACHDATTCWGPSPAATNLTGYDATTFAAATQVHYPLLTRTAANPLNAVNMVFVPYCTGDVHAGTLEADFEVNNATMPTYFWGGHDLDLFLARLVPTFAQTSRVWVTGTSAGGYGTFMTFDQVARAFPVRVDMIDDSGPPITANGAGDVSPELSVWGVVPPPTCTSCNSMPDIFAFDRQSQPNSKYAFLTFAQDTVISVRLDYTLAQYPAVMTAFSMSLADDPNAATYIVTNEQSHVVQTDDSLAPDYLPWLTQMVNDDPAWADATYAHP